MVSARPLAGWLEYIERQHPRSIATSSKVPLDRIIPGKLTDDDWPNGRPTRRQPEDAP